MLWLAILTYIKSELFAMDFCAHHLPTFYSEGEMSPVHMTLPVHTLMGLFLLKVLRKKS